MLDKYKISKTFFVKTDQEDCAYLDAPSKPAETPAQTATKPEEAPQKNTENVRSAVVPDAPAVIVEANEAKEAEKLVKTATTEENEKKQPVKEVPERIMEVAEAIKEELPTDDAKMTEEKPIETLVEKVEENMEEPEKST